MKARTYGILFEQIPQIYQAIGELRDGFELGSTSEIDRHLDYAQQELQLAQQAVIDIKVGLDEVALMDWNRHAAPQAKATRDAERELSDG